MCIKSPLWFTICIHNDKNINEETFFKNFFL